MWIESGRGAGWVGWRVVERNAERRHEWRRGTHECVRHALSGCEAGKFICVD